MATTLISSRRDLFAWVDDHLGEGWEDRICTTVTDAIAAQAHAAGLRWGSNWHDFLDSLDLQALAIASNK